MVVSSISTEITPIKYGALYNWYAASKNGGTGVGSIAPEGWHVPSESEWLILDSIAGSDNGIHLCESGTIYWDSPNISDNSSGFSARGNGNRISGLFNQLKYIFNV